MILHNLESNSFLHHKGNTFCACFALFHQKKLANGDGYTFGQFIFSICNKLLNAKFCLHLSRDVLDVVALIKESC